MSSFIAAVSIAQSASRVAVAYAPPKASLEIQKYVDGVLAGIRLEEVSHGFVMHGQLAEDLFTMRLKFNEKFFEFCLVKDIARSDGPSGIEFAFGRARESREDDFPEIVLNPFLDAHCIRDGMGLIVVGCDRIELGFEIAVVAIFLADAVPAFLHLHAICDVSRLCAQQTA